MDQRKHRAATHDGRGSSDGGDEDFSRTGTKIFPEREQGKRTSCAAQAFPMVAQSNLSRARMVLREAPDLADSIINGTLIAAFDCLSEQLPGLALKRGAGCREPTHGAQWWLPWQMTFMPLRS